MTSLVATSKLYTVLISLMSAAIAASGQNLSNKEAYNIANAAYKYAYSIVSMDVTMRQAINVPDATSVSMRAPINQFAHARSYPKASDKDVVRWNFDTMYSEAWLDLSDEPMILTVPDMKDRYFMIPMLDMWTDVFAVIGTRTTGNGAGVYAITAPDWKGQLPNGIIKIVAPTPNIWILGRIQADGPSDYDAVHKLQDSFSITPFSKWGKRYQPPTNIPTNLAIDNKTSPFYQVNSINGIEMLTRLATLMQTQPPHGNDYPILFQLKKFGIEVGKPFDSSKVSPELRGIINKAAKDALKELEFAGKTGVGLTKANGWLYTAQTVGTYGTTYRQRAQATLIGLGANLPEDAIYPATFVDGEGKPYSGSNKYVLHFEKNAMPPAQAFWSVTLYDKDGFQVANPLNRFAVGNHFSNDKLKTNTDGSIDIYIQHNSPGKEKEPNWLPTPDDEFNLCLRIYSPEPAMLNGEWTPPPIKKVQ